MPCLSYRPLGRTIHTHYADMKTTFALLLFTASFVLRVASQGFANLDFERARVLVNDPAFGALDWNVAAPGWGHSSGSDTSIVYYRAPHVGVSQYYLLVDSLSFSGSLLAGRYSLAFAGGHLSSVDPDSPWVQAYISQTGVIPGDAQSIRLLATGPFGVFVGGTPIAMQSLGGNAYAGDISAFAGSSAEFRIVNTSPTVQVPVVADDITFSPVAVPEPSTVVLIGAALGSLLACRLAVGLNHAVERMVPRFRLVYRPPSRSRIELRRGPYRRRRSPSSD